MLRPFQYAAGALAFGFLVLSGLWALGIFGSSLFSPYAPSAEDRAPWQQFRTAAAIGTEEDPFARRRYDWMRLRDPETGRIPPNIRKKELSFAKGLSQMTATANSWSPRGPANIGGRSRALAYDRSDPSGSTILAGGVSGGMWRTTNGGQSWTQTFDAAQRPSVTTLTQDTRPGNTDTWYAGTGEFIGNSASGGGPAFYSGNGIYKSTDGGRTWSLLSSTTGEPTDFDRFFDYVWRVRTDASNSSQDEVYAATYGRIYRSTDGGATWTDVLKSNRPDGSTDYASRTDVAITSDGVVYATMSSDGDRCGLFRSVNGTNWTEITPSDWPGGQTCQSDYFRTVVGVSPSREEEVWFAAHAPQHGPMEDDGDRIGHVLWKYDADANGGSGGWTNYSDYLPTRGGFLGSFASQGGYDLLVAVHPDDPSGVFVGGVNLWRLDVSGSAEGAAAWIGGYGVDGGGFYNPPGSDPQHPDQHALAFHPTSPDTMLTGSDGGVHQTFDNRTSSDGGVTYTSLNNGYLTTQFYQVCMNSNDEDPTIMGGMQDNGTWFTRSTNVSVPWSRQRGADGGYCEITDQQSRAGTFRYASSQGGIIVQGVHDASGTQTGRHGAFPQGATGQLFIHPFEIDPADPSVLYYPAGDSLYRNRRLETSPFDQSEWTSFPAAPSGHTITAVTAAQNNDPHVLYYGATDTEPPLEASRLFRAENATGPFDPQEITAPDAFPEGGFPSDIAIDPLNSDRVLVAFSNYDVTSLFYTTNGGESWTDVEGNLGGPNGPSVRSVAILPQPGLNRTSYYAATSIGLYSATDIGPDTDWSQESPDGIGVAVVDAIEARSSDGQLLAGTHGNGVYSSSAPVPAALSDFTGTFESQDESRRILLEWKTTQPLDPNFEVQHRYRGQSFSTEASVKKQGSRAYRYEVSPLPPGPHSFTLIQRVDENTSFELRNYSVTVPPRGQYDLTQPAPNPFRRTTTMRLTVKKTQPVRAVLYNTLGQRVAVLLDKTLQENQPIDLRVDGGSLGLGSGSYFIQITGDTFQATRKAVVAR